MTTSLDLSKVPRDQRGWQHFVQQVGRTDDRAERYFLELKSDLDLNKKEHRCKVAKFVLGAANRAPDRAARRFEGHALMVLGVSHNSISGIEPFEAKDLEVTVNRHVGADGPQWDFERVPTNGDRDVIVIVVDPPTGDTIWTCLADGAEGLRDGAIYIRGDGETREAKGAEVRAIAERVRKSSAPLSLSVNVGGAVSSIAYTDDSMRIHVERIRSALQQAGKPRNTSSFLPAYTVMHRPEKRTPEQYSSQIDKWASDALSSTPALVDDLAGIALPRNYISIENTSLRFLEDVEVQIHIGGAVRGVDALPKDTDPLDALPRRPRPWGPTPIDFHSHSVSYIGPVHQTGYTSSYGTVSYQNGGSVDLSLNLRTLRPREKFVSVSDEFVLVTTLTGQEGFHGAWSATAKGIDNVLEGELNIPVATTKDFNEVLDHLLNSPG